MKNWLKRWSPEQQVSLLLRAGLAFVFGYAAFGSLFYPNDWLGYLPSFLLDLSFAKGILFMIAVGELLLVIWLLSGRYVRYAALLSAIMFVGIILAQPSVFIVTFRDIGLLFMALALAALKRE